MNRLTRAARGVACAVAAAGMYVLARRWRRAGEAPVSRAARKAARKRAVERANSGRR